MQVKPSIFGTKLIKLGKEYLRDPMCFIQLEMTDSDPKLAQIAEIAVYLVTGNLKETY